MRLLSALSPLAIVRQLRLGKDASTFERLGRSRHVADLRLIFSVTIIIIGVGSALALLFCFEHELVSNWKKVEDSQSGWIWVWLALSAISDSGVVIGAIGATGCGVLAWTYQTGSARLGVVDLFACEIATLCRVAAVTEMVQRYVDLFSTDRQTAEPHASSGDIPVNPGRFSSQESYFPVFESAIKDLQQLEEDVVKNVTAFYT